MVIYATVRVLSTATPAARVLFNLGPLGEWVILTIHGHSSLESSGSFVLIEPA